jgi:predicted nucleotidyltransferase
MQPTTYPHVNQLLEQLRAQMQAILGEKLVGLYLYGSLVRGDFDDNLSDIDMLAAIKDDLNDADFQALDKMHQGLMAESPEWDDRIEIAYLSLRGLQTFKTEDSKMGIISPGEPFHIVDAGKSWLINWYFVLDQGVILYGAQPDTIIAPVSKAEFIQSVKDHLVEWQTWVDKVYLRPYQAYTILTMCRSLYTTTYGEQVSKTKAAEWAAEQFPEWAKLIQKALVWRQASLAETNENIDHEATIPDMRRFVEFTIDRVVG